MKKIIKFKFKNNKINKLNEFILNKIYWISHNIIKKSVKNILINNKIKNKYNVNLIRGDEISGFIIIETKKIRKNKNKINILYEDDDLIIINKNKNTLSSLNRNDYKNTIINRLKNYFKYKNHINIENKYGLLNRLDKDTIGVLMVAKNLLSFLILKKQFKYKNIKRFYVGITNKIINIPYLKIKMEKDKKLFNIIIKDTKNKNHETVTFFKILKNNLTLFKLYTGKTNQIRSQCHFLNNNLINDLKYYHDIKINKYVLIFYNIIFEHPIKRYKFYVKIHFPQEIIKFLK